MERPSDAAAPPGKRRPGGQLTKDNFDDDDDSPAADPGVWGKADSQTMARRKVVRARRAGGVPEPTSEPAQVAVTSADAGSAPANPFAGVSLTGTAAAAGGNPFSGVSLVAVAASTKVDVASSQPASDAPGDDAAGKAQGEAGSAADGAAPSSSGQAPSANDVAEAAADAAAGSSKAAGAATGGAADGHDDSAPASDTKAGNTDATDLPKPSAGGLFGSNTAFGFGSGGGFGSLGSTGGGFGSLGSSGSGGGGFGGFAAAAKDGGSLFGGYTAPKPGSLLFAAAPAFGAPAKQSAAGGDGDEDDAEGGAEGADGGEAVFGGPDTAPVVQLSEVPKQTGEEDEDVLYSADGALYEFVADKREWRERGKGEVRINTRRDSGRARLVMRQRGSQKLLLNAGLYAGMSTSKMVGGKGVTFAAANAAATATDTPADSAGEGKGGDGKPDCGSGAPLRTYALKLKSVERVDEFITTVDAHKAAGGEDADQQQRQQPNATGEEVV